MNSEALLNSNVMKISKVTKLNQGWNSPPQSNTMSISPLGKELQTNTSMDSGVAGLRDTPIHTLGPLHVNTSPNQNNNNNANNSKPTDDYDIPKFIVDQTTRTTYMKGRFLGKVRFLIFFLI